MSEPVHTEAMGLDVPIYRSYWRYGLLGLLLVVVLILAWQAGLGLWCVLLGVVFVLLVWTDGVRPSLGHLVLKEDHRQIMTAECLMVVGDDEQLWHGVLVGASDLGVAMVLEFKIDEPSKCSFSQVIFPDMVEEGEFSRLRAMMRFL